MGFVRKITVHALSDRFLLFATSSSDVRRDEILPGHHVIKHLPCQKEDIYDFSSFLF